MRLIRFFKICIAKLLRLFSPRLPSRTITEKEYKAAWQILANRQYIPGAVAYDEEMVNNCIAVRHKIEELGYIKDGNIVNMNLKEIEEAKKAIVMMPMSKGEEYHALCFIQFLENRRMALEN